VVALMMPSVAGAQQVLPEKPVPPGKGFGFNAPLFPAGQGNRAVDAAAAAGASHMRMSIHWRAYESVTNAGNPVPPSLSLSKPLGQPTGHGDTDRVDKEYLALTTRGMKPILMINSVPAWASTFHTCLTNPADQVNPSKCPSGWRTDARVLYPATDRLPEFRQFVEAVARRYPEALIEGTNEPDYIKLDQPEFAPVMGIITGQQCTLANAVRAVDPSRPILSPGFFQLPYTEEFVKALPKGHICFTHLSYHPSGSTQIRAGKASSPEAILAALRVIQGPGRKLWITETGLSSYVAFNDEQYRDKAAMMGEPPVARALPRWVRYFGDQPDVDGVLVHTLRQAVPASEGESHGRALLNEDWTVRDAGPGTVPRFCYFVLAAGNTYPGCEGFSLPAATPPTPPSFFKAPYLIFGPSTKVGGKTVVLFLEEGNPLPDSVNIRWMSCDATGLGCQERARQTGHYIVQASDRFRRLKVVVTLRNPYGTAGNETLLSPIITG
jgi:hypothetical protein